MSVKKIRKIRRRKHRRPTRKIDISLPGYDDGFNQGYDKGYDIGYEKGKHDGGNAIVDRLLPDYEILPDVPVEEIIAAGLDQLRPHFVHLLTPEELGKDILHALETKEPFSLVRLGDGELLTMAQQGVMSDDEIRQEGAFLDYAGVSIPDLETKNRLLNAVKQATVVGIPKLREKNYQPLAMSVFKANGIDYRELRLTDSLINYYLYQEGFLSRILHGRKIIVIGNTAPTLAQILTNNGLQVTGVVSPVHGVKDVDRIINEAARCTFDIALVPAGIASVIICEQIASRYGKVTIDFGHLADALINGDTPFK